MAKIKVIYICQKCGAQSPKWAGQCGDCGEWNTLVEEHIQTGTPVGSANSQYAGEQAALTRLMDVETGDVSRTLTGLDELDRVLGGGLVTGSVVLIGGDPGIGKSTLLLQALSHLSKSQSVLYVTGEESLQQVSLRAKRLDLKADDLCLLADTNIENIIQQTKSAKPQTIVVDSVQTIFTQALNSAPGSVSQLRESTASLVRFAKQTQTSVLLVGHVTKEGTLAGPRVLEHMVDSVLYFEGERDSRFRVIRAVKNRFGAVNELGIFAMTDKGLKGVNNPSAIFLSRNTQPVAGSVVMATWEGSRPMLVEVQALVDSSHLANPRRVTIGLEQNRLSMLLAVLHRHGGVATYDQDVFVNVVGGVKVLETASDLALLLSILSSLRNRVLSNELVVFGEVGLAGEIRPVQSGQQRLYEAAKHGFKRAIMPKANLPKTLPKGIVVHGVQSLREALDLI